MGGHYVDPGGDEGEEGPEFVFPADDSAESDSSSFEAPDDDGAEEEEEIREPKKRTNKYPAQRRCTKRQRLRKRALAGKWRDGAKGVLQQTCDICRFY
jgi:hypothetical protein